MEESVHTKEREEAMNSWETDGEGRSERKRKRDFCHPLFLASERRAE